MPRAGPPEDRGRIAVIGGGVVGLAIARELAGAGLAVEVFEARQAGAGASTAAVGVLSAPKGERTPFARLSSEGYRLQASLARELREETGMDVGYVECGSVRLFAKAPPSLEKLVARERALGRTVEIADRRAIEEVVPGYGGRADCALVTKEEAAVDPHSLVNALSASLRIRGGLLHEGTGDVDLVFEPGEGLGLRAQGKTLAPPGRHRRVVLAAGVHSPCVLSSLPGPPLPVRPIRGQAIEVRHPAPRRIVRFTASFNERDYFLVPRGADRIWVGSTVEDAGFDASPTPAGRDELLRAAREVLPDLAGDAVERHWAGLRPQAMRRGGPFLAPWPGVPNLWVACGHYRSGILTAPSTAHLLRAAILEGAPLPPEFGL